ncbi:MAG: hypothetical protein IRZ05_20295 [Micromonosporaceae bacterium]|nr:hypothetical protein [Micromonosporaceae bacterium]
MKRYVLVVAAGLLPVMVAVNHDYQPTGSAVLAPVVPAVVQFWATERSVSLWRRWRTAAVLLLALAVVAGAAWWAYIFAVLAWLDRPLVVVIAGPTVMVALLALAGLISGRTARAGR